VKQCRFRPGLVTLADLEPGALLPAGVKLLPWARINLRASEGPKVMRIYEDGRREVLKIPTIVMAGRDDFSCLQLHDGRCGVYANAPFGCAFFDCRQDRRESTELVTKAHEEIMKDRQQGGLYSWLWDILDGEGLKAPPLADRQAAMDASPD